MTEAIEIGGLAPTKPKGLAQMSAEQIAVSTRMARKAGCLAWAAGPKPGTFSIPLTFRPPDAQRAASRATTSPGGLSSNTAPFMACSTPNLNKACM